MVRAPEPGAADPPNSPEGGDAEEVPKAEEGSLGGSVWPEERVVCKEDGGEAGDIDAGESVPCVEEPGDGRLDLRAGE
jgi:hypothetical protein